MAKQHIFNIKTSISPLIPGKFVPSMKYIPKAMKSGKQSRSSSLIINIIFEIADRDLDLKA